MFSHVSNIAVQIKLIITMRPKSCKSLKFCPLPTQQSYLVFCIALGIKSTLFMTVHGVSLKSELLKICPASSFTSLNYFPSPQLLLLALICGIHDAVASFWSPFSAIHLSISAILSCLSINGTSSRKTSTFSKFRSGVHYSILFHLSIHHKIS